MGVEVKLFGAERRRATEAKRKEKKATAAASGARVFAHTTHTHAGTAGDSTKCLTFLSMFRLFSLLFFPFSASVFCVFQRMPAQAPQRS